MGLKHSLNAKEEDAPGNQENVKKVVGAVIMLQMLKRRMLLVNKM